MPPPLSPPCFLTPSRLKAIWKPSQGKLFLNWSFLEMGCFLWSVFIQSLSPTWLSLVCDPEGCLITQVFKEQISRISKNKGVVIRIAGLSFFSIPDNLFHSINIITIITLLRGQSMPDWAFLFLSSPSCYSLGHCLSLIRKKCLYQ